jgi:hypothetical protein
MSGGFEMGIDKDEWDAFTTSVKENLSHDAQQAVLEETAQVARRDLIELTPKKSGGARAGWQVYPGEDGGRKVQNSEANMLYLEEGTRDHGPAHAKSLFIPQRPTVLPKKGGGSKYVFGVDFILTKHVRGIKAMHIVQNYIPTVVQKLMDRAMLQINKALGD